MTALSLLALLVLVALADPLRSRTYPAALVLGLGLMGMFGMRTGVRGETRAS